MHVEHNVSVIFCGQRISQVDTSPNGDTKQESASEKQRTPDAEETAALNLPQEDPNEESGPENTELQPEQGRTHKPKIL